MALRPEDLPKDPALLTELALALAAKNEALQATVAKLQRLIFGARSERMAVILAEQLALELGDLATATIPAPANDDAAGSAKPGSQAGQKKPNRNIGALPKHLPRFDVVIEPEATICRCCAGALHRIGEDVSEVLDRIPAVLRVVRTIRPKYSCRACEDITQAPAPARLIEGGMVSTALVSHIAAAKYGWYSTLYRQMQIIGGLGVPVDRSTLARWMKHMAWTLQGVYRLQLAEMHSYARLFCDETPMPVIEPGRPRTKICQFWTHMPPMTGRGAGRRRRRWPMCLRKDAAKRRSQANLRGLPACCRLTDMRPTRRWRATSEPPEKFASPFVLPMPGENSSMFTSGQTHPSRAKSLSAWPRFMRSRSEFVAPVLRTDAPSGRLKQNRSWRHYTPGLSP